LIFFVPLESIEIKDKKKKFHQQEEREKKKITNDTRSLISEMEKLK